MIVSCASMAYSYRTTRKGAEKMTETCSVCGEDATQANGATVLHGERLCRPCLGEYRTYLRGLMGRSLVVTHAKGEQAYELLYEDRGI